MSSIVGMVASGGIAAWAWPASVGVASVGVANKVMAEKCLLCGNKRN